ncbi:hypothetical protein NDU88_001076 [Pleurodeles waltl]|uniref:Uncharacterized protein n=1 Tax=Pleurodeles waltl TaxID=8319 RepID=A0AAV7SYJ6_PLEWA|nr:hypothetical protein NDU88_001075 [Pleurodeles waltl]KAJ1169170.1 hypothetical protein NDU88_001076 [Pleurodeles waltl]
MAYYAAEDDYYQDTPEVPTEKQMEARLVEPLGHHVQVSVNQALIKALKLFAQPLIRFGQRELLGRSPSENEIRDGQIPDSESDKERADPKLAKRKKKTHHTE